MTSKHTVSALADAADLAVRDPKLRNHVLGDGLTVSDLVRALVELVNVDRESGVSKSTRLPVGTTVVAPQPGVTTVALLGLSDESKRRLAKQLSPYLAGSDDESMGPWIRGRSAEFPVWGSAVMAKIGTAGMVDTDTVTKRVGGDVNQILREQLRTGRDVRIRLR